MAFQIDDWNCLVPDVAFFRNQGISLSARYFQGTPDIAFEVISTERLSYFEAKLSAFFRGGALYVCSIHLDTRTVTVYSRHGVTRKSGSEALEFPDILPGFSLPVNTLFEGIEEPCHSS